MKLQFYIDLTNIMSIRDVQTEYINQNLRLPELLYKKVKWSPESWEWKKSLELVFQGERKED